MKNKKASVNSVEIIHNINGGKLVKEKVEVKIGSVFPLPLDREIITARTSIIINQGNLKAVEHLADIMKEDRVGEYSASAIKSLNSVVGCKLDLDLLQLHKRVYEMVPEIDGMTIGFDKSFTGFKILKNEDKDINTLESTLTAIQELHDVMKPKNSKIAEKMTENVDRLKGLDIPASQKTELAQQIAKTQVIMERIEKAEAEGIEPNVTDEELKAVKEGADSVESIIAILKKDGGVA